MRSFQKYRAALITGVSTALLVWFSAFLPAAVPFRHRMEYICQDSWTRLTAGRHTGDVLLVIIDDVSIRRIGPWPWSRSRLAELVKRIAEGGARVVGIDIMLNRSRPGDAEMACSLRQIPATLAVHAEDRDARKVARLGIKVDRCILPAANLAGQAVSLGHLALVYDDDGVVRRIPAFMTDGASSFPAFSLSLAALSRGPGRQKGVIADRLLRLHGQQIPVDRYGFFFIGYQGGPGTFPRVSAVDVLRGAVEPRIFRNRIVLIGVTAVGLADSWSTPFINQGAMAGVEVHANALQSLLWGRVIRQAPIGLQAAAVLLAGIGAALLAEMLPVTVVIGLIMVVPVLVWGVGALIFSLATLLVSVPLLSAAWGLAAAACLGTRVLRYRRQLHWTTRQIERISKISDRLSLAGYCRMLAEITQAEQIIGVFIGKNDRLEVASWPPEKERQRELATLLVPLHRPGDSELAARVGTWARARDPASKIFPIPTETTGPGLFILVPRSGHRMAGETLELARGFASRAALLLEYHSLCQQFEQNCKGTIEVIMATMEKKTPGLSSHSAMVARVARSIAERLGLDREACSTVYRAGLLHDLGLIGIPDRVVHGRDSLLPEERVWIESHPGLGAELLSHAPKLGDCAAAVRHHHERYDGRGYPDGLAGKEIPLQARILGVAEAFVSICANRRQEGEPGSVRDKALVEIRRCSGSQFDPEIVTILCDSGTELPEEVEIC